jgi:hypothetical protein
MRRIFDEGEIPSLSGLADGRVAIPEKRADHFFTHSSS